MKEIYVVFGCDEWKTRKSMSLMAATTSPYKLKNILVRKIRRGDMEYKKGDETLPVEEQVKSLKSDWNARGTAFVFGNLDYGYVETVNDGEIL